MKQLGIISLLCFLSISVFAQRSYVRKAIEKDQKEKHQGQKEQGEKAVDERLDAWDASDKKSREKVEPFPTMSYTMDMEFPDKPKNNMAMHYTFKGYQCAMEMHSEKDKNQETRTIMNFKEGKTVVLTTDKKGRKSGMEMELKMLDWGARAAVKSENEKLKNNEATLKATDEYKTIEGYKCRKYEYRSDRHKSDLWVTTDIKMDYMNYNKAMASVFASQSYTQMEYYKAGIKGVTIQIHTYPNSERDKESILTMKDIKTGTVNENVFSTEGYEIQKMPSVRDMWDSFKKEN